MSENPKDDGAELLEKLKTLIDDRIVRMMWICLPFYIISRLVMYVIIEYVFGKIN